MKQPPLRLAVSILSLAALVPLSCKVNDSGVAMPPAPASDRRDGGPGSRPPPDAREAGSSADGDGVALEAGAMSADARGAEMGFDGASAPAVDGADPASAPDAAAEAAPVETGPPAPPAVCAQPLPAVGAARRLPSGTGRSDDFTFDREGHFVSFAGRSLARMSRADGRVEILAPDVIGARGGTLRALPGGGLMVADFERDSLLTMSASGEIRRLPAAVDNPMKMMLGPSAGVYITGKDGVVFRAEQTTGAITRVATTPFELGGLAFSPDYRVLYVGAIGNDTIQSFEVRADLTLGPPRMVRAQIPRAQALATDECGNLYVVSEGDARVRRISIAGMVEVIADLGEAYPWSLAFGSGQQGWSGKALYVHEAGSGRLYEIPLGVAGAAPPP